MKKKYKKLVENQQSFADLIPVTNNMIAGLAIILIVASAVTTTMVYYQTSSFRGERMEIVGKASDVGYGTAKICINWPPRINVSCAEAAQVGNEYYCDQIFADDERGDLVNLTLDTTLFNLSYNPFCWQAQVCGIVNFTPTDEQRGWHLINVRSQDNMSCSNSISTHPWQLVVCKEPKWDKFKNNLTTNLSRLDCWTHVENLTIGVPNGGQVDFGFHEKDIDGYDLDAHLNITHNLIKVNITGTPGLRAPASVWIYNISVKMPRIIWNGAYCYPWICSTELILGDTAKDILFSVGSFYGNYTIVEGGTLVLGDDSDLRPNFVNNPMNFHADFRWGNNSKITDGTCRISINETGTYGSGAVMSFDPVTQNYTYAFTPTLKGLHWWNVTCNDRFNATIFAYDSYYITNRMPVLIAWLPNETWFEDSVLTGRDLDNYIMDPDGDPLTFNYTLVANIRVDIDEFSHKITLTPDSDWFGERLIRYFAYDDAGGWVQTNWVLLTVVEVVESMMQQSSPSSPPQTPTPCVEKWVCSEWGPCLPAGVSLRICEDLTACGTKHYKPNASRSCRYIPTCFDHIKNAGEKGVDCGGPCPPCPTCSDGEQNQGEMGVDCGGPCDPCPTCTDRMQNQGEAGIDCGGPCNPCPTCRDGIKNQGEAGIDCGGSCPPCPTCSDGIRNQGEEEEDCGGPCEACPARHIPFAPEKFPWIIVILDFLIASYLAYRRGRIYLKNDDEERPASKAVRKFGLGIAVCLAVLILIAYIYGQRIILNILIVLEFVTLLLESPICMVAPKVLRQIRRLYVAVRALVQFKSPRLEEIRAEISLNLDRLEKRIGEDAESELFDELFLMIQGTLTQLFDLKYEFTLADLTHELENKAASDKLRDAILDYYKTITEIRYKELPVSKELLRELIADARSIVRRAIMEKAREVVKKDVKQIDLHIRILQRAIGSGDAERIRDGYTTVLAMYNELDEGSKRKAYRKIKKLHRQITLLRIRKRQPGRFLPVLLVVALTLLLTLVAPARTGFTVLDSEALPPQIEEIPFQTIRAGEAFHYRLNVIGGEGAVTISKDSQMIDIVDGEIRLDAEDSMAGKHLVVIIARDQKKRYATTPFRFQVIK
ncbi:MAG: hypothetical protein ABH879_06355 [archaeon]